jgi:hypothetical protein
MKLSCRPLPRLLGEDSLIFSNKAELSVVLLLALLKLNRRAVGCAPGEEYFIVFMRAAGGLDSLCMRRGGVGKALGRSRDAAFRRASEGSREEMREEFGGECWGVEDPVGEGGEV